MKSCALALGLSVTLALMPAVMREARGGPTSSGGASGIVCENRVELYDLFISRIRFGAVSVTVEEDPKTYLQKLIIQIPQSSFRAVLWKNLERISSTQQWEVPEGLSLRDPSDHGSQEAILIPDGCTLQTLGYYEGSGTLVMSRRLRQLDRTNMAAFLWHETLYLTAREIFYSTPNPITDTYFVRKTVATFFDRRSSDEAKMASLRQLFPDKTVAVAYFGINRYPTHELKLFPSENFVVIRALPAKKILAPVTVTAPQNYVGESQLLDVVKGRLVCLDAALNDVEIPFSTDRRGAATSAQVLLPSNCAYLGVVTEDPFKMPKSFSIIASDGEVLFQYPSEHTFESSGKFQERWISFY